MILKPIDRFLNRITMYRTVLYGLAAIVIVALAWSLTSQLSYSPLAMVASLATLLASAYLSNLVLAKIWQAPVNTESSLITALILFFLVGPTLDPLSLALLAGVSTVAMASKYVFAVGRQHIFNPVAVAAVLAAASGLVYPIWWVGSSLLLPAVVVVGFLIARKIRRLHIALTTIAVALVVFVCRQWLTNPGFDLAGVLQLFFLSWPIVFFATVMVTEPLTTPPTKLQQYLYAALVGALSSLSFGLGPIHSSPELALLIGNLFFWPLTLRRRLIVPLLEKAEIAKDTWEFVFKKPAGVTFTAGQYLEWTLHHSPADSRGVRRYFTIASAPTEDVLRLGVKITQQCSSFKKKLQNLAIGEHIVAGQLAGDFVMPTNPNEHMVWIAGGIGVTPFRAMMQQIIDDKQKRDVVLLYANNYPADIAYGDVCKEAEAFGVKTVPVITKDETWLGEKGYIDAAMIERQVPGWQDRSYYISGPSGMVDAYKKVLRQMGIASNKIVTDYFPGFA